MMLLMRDVVLNQKPQRHRLVVANMTFSIKLLNWNTLNHSLKNLVIRLPPVQQRTPWHLVIAMRRNPSLLRIKGPGIAAIERPAPKALMIVRRRIDHVSKHLLARPSTRAPRQAGNIFRHL